MSTLELELKKALRDEGYTDSEKESIKNYLILLEDHPPTLEHSIRVGLKAREIANFLGIHRKEDRKQLIKSALLHDIGKYFINRDILTKVTSYTKKDHEKMKKHPEYGYRLLRLYDPTVAEIVLRHHKYQKAPYPLTLPKITVSKEKMKKVEKYARIISLIDFYDALMTRKNEKFRADLSNEEAKQILIDHNPDLKGLIVKLYNAGIFGRKK